MHLSRAMELAAQYSNLTPDLNLACGYAILSGICFASGDFIKTKEFYEHGKRMFTQLNELGNPFFRQMSVQQIFLEPNVIMNNNVN